MKQYFAYIRVSTKRQGEQGASLPEQRRAIEKYAHDNELSIIAWFEEQETAAKRGRPIFSRMLSQLEARAAAGVIIHKIDRSARNLKDWANLGDLIDAGVDVRFVYESIDLSTRGGRLSADIQAVVAADYIRNMRDEIRKGINGRLKDGIYPLPAPLGYLNTGGGKAKIIDPARGPLVRTAFGLYASGLYTMKALRDELNLRGLHHPRRQGTFGAILMERPPQSVLYRPHAPQGTKGNVPGQARAVSRKGGIRPRTTGRERQGRRARYDA